MTVSNMMYIHYALTFLIWGILIYGFLIFPKSLYAEMGKIFSLQKRGETSKSKNRRISEGFFQKYCQGRGLDIGYGGDLLTPTCSGWEMDQGDAQYLAYVQDGYFDFVYASHVLEHMVDLQETLKNWARVLKPGGYLIFAVPERDLFEKKLTLPSMNNPDHKHFFLLDRDEAPDTVGVVPMMEKYLPHFKIEYAKVLSDKIEYPKHPYSGDREYQIEVVARKS